MSTDLTERLAAKLEGVGLLPEWAYTVARWSREALPLLLSEPELVASLPDEVRLSVLSEDDWKALMVGRAALRVMESQGDDSEDSSRRRLWSAAWFAYPRGVESSDVALTPEGKDGD